MAPGPSVLVVNFSSISVRLLVGKTKNNRLVPRTANGPCLMRENVAVQKTHCWGVRRVLLVPLCSVFGFPARTDISRDVPLRSITSRACLKFSVLRSFSFVPGSMTQRVTEEVDACRCPYYPDSPRWAYTKKRPYGADSWNDSFTRIPPFPPSTPPLRPTRAARISTMFTAVSMSSPAGGNSIVSDRTLHEEGSDGAIQ